MWAFHSGKLNCRVAEKTCNQSDAADILSVKGALADLWKSPQNLHDLRVWSRRFAGTHGPLTTVQGDVVFALDKVANEFMFDQSIIKSMHDQIFSYHAFVVMRY